MLKRERVARVRAMWLRGASDLQIQSRLSVEFGCTCRAVRRYIKHVREKFEANEAKNAESTRARAESMLLEAFRLARRKKDPKAMAICAHRLAELNGAVGARRIEVTGRNGGPLQSETVARVVMLPPLDEPAEPPGDPVEAAPGPPDSVPRVDRE